MDLGEAMKKTKKRPQSLGKTWSQDQQIMFELALDTLSSLAAILKRIGYNIDDKEKAEVYFSKALELHEERDIFDGFDDDIVKDIVETYSPLIREYYDMKQNARELAITGKGLPDKYFTTKVDYAKYGR